MSRARSTFCDSQLPARAAVNGQIWVFGKRRRKRKGVEFVAMVTIVNMDGLLLTCMLLQQRLQARRGVEGEEGKFRKVRGGLYWMYFLFNYLCGAFLHCSIIIIVVVVVLEIVKLFGNKKRFD